MSEGALVLLETHCHTMESSHCSRIPARDLIEALHGRGYAGVVITDHYMWDMDLASVSARRRFLDGYFRAKEAGEQLGLAVMPGMEIRFRPTADDFLIYGMEEEDFLTLPDDLCETSLSNLRALADAHGWMIYQAHPFRTGMILADPALLDGIEVYNGNPGINNLNELAPPYARAHGLRALAGSDVHTPDGVGAAATSVSASALAPKKLVEWLLRTAWPAMEVSLP